MGMTAQLLDGKPDANVADAIEALPVGHWVLWHSRLEAIGLPDDPAGQIAVARQPANTQAIRVGPTLGNDSIVLEFLADQPNVPSRQFDTEGPQPRL